MSKKMRCEKCKWWEFTVGPEDGDECTIGDCHRNAPHCKLTENECSPCAVWAITNACDWCGEFKEKENE